MVATITQTTKERVDDALSRLEERWREAVALSAEWDELDEHDQIDFSAEWPLTIDALGRVRKLADQGLLDATQQTEFERILAYMRAHVDDVAGMITEEYARLALPKE
jgi:hypothetical protein